MDLAPPRTLQVVLPSRREANFQDFALLLLHRFFTNFPVHFSMDFGTIFAPRSLQHGLQNFNKKCSDFNVLFYWFLVDFGLHLGTNFPTKLLKKGGPSLTPPRFLLFSLLVASLGYPLAPISLIFDLIWEDFPTIFSSFLKQFFNISIIVPHIS